MAAKKSTNSRLIVDINKNFVIRYKLEDEPTKLIGAGKYNTIIQNQDLADKHFNKALDSGLDRITFKLRGGKNRPALEVTFVSK